MRFNVTVKVGELNEEDENGISFFRPRVSLYIFSSSPFSLIALSTNDNGSRLSVCLFVSFSTGSIKQSAINFS